MWPDHRIATCFNGPDRKNWVHSPQRQVTLCRSDNRVCGFHRYLFSSTSVVALRPMLSLSVAFRCRRSQGLGLGAAMPSICSPCSGLISRAFPFPCWPFSFFGEAEAALFAWRRRGFAFGRGSGRCLEEVLLGNPVPPSVVTLPTLCREVADLPVLRSERCCRPSANFSTGDLMPGNCVVGRAAGCVFVR